MTLKIYTAMYSYSGNDKLDITVKGQDPIGKIFAPTWGMVNHYKKYRDKISYMGWYYKLMVQSYTNYKEVWEEILKRDRVTLVCYCRPGFCHRFLLKDYLVRLGGIYIKERRL